MEREIKFRAWDNAKKQMFYIENMRYLMLYDDGSGQVRDNRNLQIMECNEENPIMQFVGIKDNNGIDIYEGDVIQWTNGDNYTVEFDKDNCSYTLIENDEHKMGYGLYKSEAEKYTVIGNIFDNPDLITTNIHTPQK